MLELRRDIGGIARGKKFGSEELDRILERLEEISGLFFRLFGEFEGRTGFTAREAFLDKNRETYSDLLAALELTASHLKLMKNAPEDVFCCTGARSKSRKR